MGIASGRYHMMARNGTGIRSSRDAACIERTALHISCDTNQI